MRLVLTPPPHPTECVSGYLLRLGSTNGYGRPYCIVGHVQKSWHSVNFYRVTPEVLSEVTGLLPEASKRLCVIPSGAPKKGIVSLLGNELHVAEVDLETIRICPVCIAKTGRHEAIWHLKAFPACPIHKISLLDCCEACGKPLRWNRPSIDRCNCGASLVEQGSREPCSTAQAELLKAMRAVFYRDATIQSFPKHLVFLQAVDAYAFSRMVIVLCEMLEGKGHREPGCTQSSQVARTVVQTHFESVARLFIDWPSGLQRFLKDRYEGVLLSDDEGWAFRDHFNWAFGYLGRHLGDRGKQFSFLMDEIYRFGARYWSRDRLMRGEWGMKTLPIEGRWGSILEAAEIMKMDSRAVSKRIALGQIPIRRQGTDKRNRNVMVDLDFARAWKKSAYPPVKLRDAARRIGIVPNLLKGLRQAGCLSVTVPTAFLRSQSFEDVERLRTLLLEIAAIHSPDGSIGKIAHQGVSLDKTRSLEKRLAMLRELIDKRSHS